jgi:hypothetical protein
MRLAWFRPATHVSDRLDDTAALVAALRSEHEIEVVDQSRAHDFIRLDFRKPFDLCVFELGDGDEYAFVWPYLIHVSGVLRLRSRSLHESRTAALRRQHRLNDGVAELALGDWDLIRVPILASRMTVVPDETVAARLRREHPESHIRHAPIGLTAFGDGDDLRPHLRPLVGSLDSSRAGVVQRAVARAREAGAQLELMNGASRENVLNQADVIVALSWPPGDELTPAIAAMAGARAVVVFETEHTAGWPALDPQTWLPRGWTGGPPIVVSVDPRDEEHSLSLALRRLASDPTLRQSLGDAAFAWWRSHATVDHATTAWRSILAEAAALSPSRRPAGWPAHLSADGTARARQILDECGAAVDFLNL